MATCCLMWWALVVGALITLCERGCSSLCVRGGGGCLSLFEVMGAHHRL